MATVFMKWLEQKPDSYDRGIRLLTLGRINRIRDDLVKKIIRNNMKVLEIGCGTGELACLMGHAGADVIGIDVAPAMLGTAEERVKREGLTDIVEVKRLNATAIGDHYPPETFDLIVASLIFSELSLNEQKLVLEQCRQLLKSGGKLVLVDEIVPAGAIRSLIYRLLRFPVVLVTFLLTRTTTRSLRNVESLFEIQGFRVSQKHRYLAGSLCAVLAEPLLISDQVEQGPRLPHLPRRNIMLRLLVDVWTLFFRMIPPYPKVSPGLYQIGDPDQDSPLFATGNFELTVKSVQRAIEGKLDAWLLVVDSAGINVWCAAGGGFLTAEKVISSLKANRAGEYVDHERIVLPQLCANGVDGWEIRKETGWEVLWGPVLAEDISAFVENDYKKTEKMRTVMFPLKARLEMVSGTFGLYGLLLLLPIAIFWHQLFWPVLMTLAGLSYFYAIALPWLPGKDGMWKSIPLTLLSVLGLILFTAIFDPVSPQILFNRALGLVALAIFVSGEFQGMSPLMRGEQANWIPEALIMTFLGLVYWLTPLLLGWRGA
jgi:ubiquinone/menaquinone biosynthesis C-methylase UbiE